MDEEAELAGAVDALYAAFQAYDRPAWFEGCGCCMDGEPIDPTEHGSWIRVRVSSPGGQRPLRELGSDELRDLAANVPVTCGSVQVFKHYLPRVFEIAATVGFDWPDLEVVVGHLNLGPELGVEPWTTWPEAERAALRNWFRSLWRQHLATPAAPIDDLLCAVGLVEPVDWFLEEWLRFEHPCAAPHLATFLSGNAAALSKGHLVNAFWSKRSPAPDNVASIVAWTRAPATLEAVAAAAQCARDPQEAAALEECFLRWLG